MSEFHLLSKPVRSIKGTISIPGDKSISHRAVILGSIAEGQTKISGFLEGEDCLCTLRAFESMGVKFVKSQSQELLIDGVGKYGLQKPKQSIDCGNSGTSMRLLSGLLAAQAFDSELVGDESLSKRPMERISRPLQQMGADIRTTNGKPPIFIYGSATLKGITYLLPEASAQVKTAILLAGLYAEGETHIIETHATRDHTERMLSAFSYPLEKSENTITMHSHARCLGTEISIPGDISSAAFFMVAATLIPGSKLKILNVGINPTRIGILKILKHMGANISILNKRLYGEEPVADLLIESALLKGIEIPAVLVPFAIDEFPIIFIAAALAEGKTIMHGLKELRHKESDRIAAMSEGLKTLNIKVHASAETVEIQGGKLQGGVVDSFGDHRIAMAFAMAGALAEDPVTIKNCSKINTSFPDFVKTASSVHLAIEELSHA